MTVYPIPVTMEVSVRMVSTITTVNVRQASQEDTVISVSIKPYVTYFIYTLFLCFLTSDIVDNLLV